MNTLNDAQKKNLPPSIRVSPRHLGQMCRPDFCPCCYWYSIALGFRFPWESPMPGIMHNMDRFEKSLVDAYFSTKHSLPKWLGPLGCTEPVEFPVKMTKDFPKYGLTLVGMPDAVFRKEDDTLCVVDFKTAKCKGDSDPYMPNYIAQLWGYVELLEDHQIGSVSSAALVYFQNDLAEYATKPLELLTSDGLEVPFTVKFHDVEIDRKALHPLLKAFRGYADLSTPPEAKPDCKTCQRLQLLFEIEQRLRGAESAIKNLEHHDSATLQSLIRRWESDRHSARVRESHGWESYLTDDLSDHADCVAGALDM